MATQAQKDQFISKTATGLDPATLDKGRFQDFLGDPNAWLRFAEFVNSYKRRNSPSIIEITPGGVVFVEWSKGRVLKGFTHQSTSIDLNAVIASAWLHPHQIGQGLRPTGHEILAALVSSYKVGEDKKGNTYQIVDGDAIHGHFGLKELEVLGDNWETLPDFFRNWAKGKTLYAWWDVVRDGDGVLNVPGLNCHVEKPFVRWDGLGFNWRLFGPALRAQVSAQA